MRRLNAFFSGAFFVAAIAPPHDHLWLDAALLVLAVINGGNALWGPREDAPGGAF